MTLLSTGFLVDLMRRDPPALELLRRLERGSHAIRIPATVWADLWESAGRSRHPPHDMARLEALLGGYSTLDLSAAHARRAGQIAAAYDLSLREAMPVAMAIEAREDIVLRDARAYERVPDLRTVSY